jgi:glucose/arabinose dehydrogenase
MPYLATALLILLLLPAGAFAQAGVSYQIPADNPLVGQAGAAPEIYALGLRNPFRFSFDRQTGDVLIGDVGQSAREEIDWIGAAAARGANFGWACREGRIGGPRASDPTYPCPVPGAVEPLFDYENPPGETSAAVTGGFVVRDPALSGLAGRYLYADFYAGDIRSLALDFVNPDDRTTGLSIASPVSFGEDAAGRLYVANLTGGEVVRLIAGATPGTLNSEPLAGPFEGPIALATFPGDSSRLFVAERGGKVLLVVGGVSTPFLDVAPFGLSTDGEGGLLSVVASPDYAATGKIYVYYTDSGGDIQIDEFTRSAADPETADPTTRRPLLTMEHSAAGNHNGGQLHFGRDGCLWITTGDGGGGNDTFNNAQNRATLLGKLLRIDPDPPGVGGTPCGAGAPVPPPGGGNAPDLAAPVVSARAKRRQRVLRLRGAIVYARCSEACSLGTAGTLHVGRRRLRLRAVRSDLAPNQRARIRVRLRPRAARLLRRALRRGGHPRVTLRLRARDGAGNPSALVRRGVRVRR